MTFDSCSFNQSTMSAEGLNYGLRRTARLTLCCPLVFCMFTPHNTPLVLRTVLCKSKFFLLLFLFLCTSQFPLSSAFFLLRLIFIIFLFIFPPSMNLFPLSSSSRKEEEVSRSKRKIRKENRSLATEGTGKTV